jgi:hypothetical protein
VGSSVVAPRRSALGEDHARAGLHRAERRTEPRRPAADHQHIGVAGEQRIARRQVDARRAVRPL